MTIQGSPAPGHVRILVSIVTYNSCEVIEECLRNLLWLRDADGVDAQVVIADNASTDSTLAAIAHTVQAGDPLVKVVAASRNLGWGAGNNLAIAARRVDPDYVVLCNPDAYIDEENFRALLTGLQRCEPLAAIAVPFLDGPSGAVLGANPEWRVSRYFIRDYWGDGYAFRRLQARYADATGEFEIRRAYASGALALISFKAMAAVGFFDERIFMFNDDIDLSRRIIGQGHALIGVAGARAHHIGGRGSDLGDEVQASTAISRLMAESDLVFIEKWYGAVWARTVAAYRWYVFYWVSNGLRRVLGRTRLDIRALRAPARDYLAARRDAVGSP